LRRVLSVVVGAALIAAVPVTASNAAPADGGPTPDPRTGRAHDLPSPLADKQREQRAVAAEQVLRGEATPQGANKVVEIADGEYVEMAQEDSDAIWTVLGEFTNDAQPLPHNDIPEPDRSVDNTTIWTPDFDRAHYQRMLHDSGAGVNSVANFYEELSSGRYTVTGTVEDWVPVGGHPAAYYGEADNDRRAWDFVNESLNSWYDRQIADGQTPDEIDAYLAQFDVWDRYDHDGDGEFDEADGYIDHFQSVHAGMGEEVGGGVLGVDAIWSHRWYNQTNPVGSAGPVVDGEPVLLGGTQVGESSYWVGDYTIEPENGGVGVFAHEFGHDLGLPDLYDTSGNTGGAENSTGFWTLMSSGSYGNNGDPEEGLGDRPIHMGAWEKFQLGWLDFALVLPGQSQTVRLGPAARDTSDTQAAIALLPDREVTIDLGDPHTGPDFFYSDQGNDLDNTMLTAKPAGGTTLTAQVRYEIEQDWDYAYAGYVNAAGSFVSLPTNLSTDTNPNGQNFGHGITGTSNGDWVPLTVDIATVPDGAQIGFRYWTDGAAVEQGFSADVVAVDGTEIPAAEWEFAGFRTTTGTETRQFFNAYIAENRAYVGYDAGLQNGPYNFGDPARPNWAERLPYQDGLLISYWNEQYQDNNVGDHPGAGLILPVDARPQLMYEPTDDEPDNGPTGEIWRSRIQSFDSTFGLQKVDSVTLHDPDSGEADQYGGSAAVPLFDDRKDWYVEAGSRPDADGWAGVDVPKTGTTIRVAAVSASGQTMQIRIN
jgi:immune inhibitor A